MIQRKLTHPGGVDYFAAAADGITSCGAFAKFDDFGDFICTRPVGHDGPHAAHGRDKQQFATWKDDPK